MQLYQRKFIEMCLEYKVLRFGEFTLKSGRISPYFFNAGLLNTGTSLAALGHYYAEAIINSTLKFNMLFGPAYKGIPLVCSTAVALAIDFQKNYGYAFNRKEAKDHGEGGLIIGQPLTGRILIIDDVITAGTAIRQSISLITESGAQPAGIVIAMDRQERGTGELSAIQEIEKAYAIPIVSLFKLENLLEYTKHNVDFEKYIPALTAYKQQYGV